jgi:Flp pilus assembly protein TadD
MDAHTLFPEDQHSKTCFYEIGSLCRQGRVDEAAVMAQGILRIDPNYSSAHTVLGIEYLHQSRYVDAAEQFHMAVCTGGMAAVAAWVGLGEALNGAGRPKEAEMALLQCILLHPVSLDA